MKTNTIVNIILGISIFIVGASALFLWYKGEQSKGAYERVLLKLESVKLKNEQANKQEIKLEKCLEEANNTYISRWNSMCVRLDKSEKTDDINKKECGIPENAARHYDDQHNKDKEFCLKLYK